MLLFSPALIEKVQANPIYQKLALRASRVLEAVRQVDLLKPVTDAHLVLADNIKAGAVRLNKLADWIVKKYIRAVDAILDVATGYAEAAIDREHYAYTRNLLQEAYLQVRPLVSTLQY